VSAKSLPTKWHGGPGKSTYTFSAERLRISTPCQASVVRASRQKAEICRRWAENVYVDLPWPNVVLQNIMVTKWLSVRVKTDCSFQANHFVDINPCVTVQDLALSRSLGGNVRKLFKKYAKTAKHFKWDYKKQKHCRYLCRKEWVWPERFIRTLFHVLHHITDPF
jgi:hypothetical protein